MGNCMGTTGFCNRARPRNRSRTQDIGICASSTSVLNQNPTAINNSNNNNNNEQQQTNLTNQLEINDNQITPSLNQITREGPTSLPNSSTSNNVNAIIANHLSSYNLYPYYVPPATGKNKRLKKDFYKYFKFDKKISEKQLQAKRDEFWDTAPAFDGKTEIWAALKAAVEACESKNFQLAQAIIDSANIILPNGLLNDCYDELGNRYEIPIYVLVKPVNLIKSSSNRQNDISIDNDSTSSSNYQKKRFTKISDEDENENDDEFNEDCFDDLTSSDQEQDDETTNNNSDDAELNLDTNNNDVKNKSKNKENKRKLFSNSKSKLNNIKLKLSPSSNDSSNSKNKSKNDGSTSDKKKSQQKCNKPLAVKLRVSALHNEQDDIKLHVNLSQTVLSLKQMLKEYIGVDPLNQRMFFGGKQLKDRDRLRSHKLRRNVVIQVIIKEADDDLIKAHLENYLKQKNETKVAVQKQVNDKSNDDNNSILPVLSENSSIVLNDESIEIKVATPNLI